MEDVSIGWIDRNREATRWYKFIQILNKVRIGNIDKDTEKMLKASRIDKDSKNFPYDKFYIFAENEQ